MTATPRRLGLLGGMAWPSTAEAYRLLNEGVNAARGGVASADLVVVSLDFAEVEALQATGDWEGAAALLGDAGARLAAAGAGAILLCTNTMHRVADAVEDAAGVPLLHIADATAEAVRAAGVGTVGLLGTRFTMEGAFYAGRLRERHGLEVVVPDADDRALVHDVIYGELVNGVVTDASRSAYLQVVERLVAAGAEGVIAGCTEIELLLGPDDVSVPWFPTTRLHVDAALRWLLAT